MIRPFSIRIAGIGGQGNLLAGYILSEAFVLMEKYVIQTQNYSEQVRGGPSYCDVLVSDEQILYPKAVLFDSLIIMHPSMVSHGKYVATNGIIIYDSTNIQNLPNEIKRITRRIIEIPASKLAIEKYGNAMVSNMILLGAFVKSTGLVDFETLFEAVREEVNPKYFEMNVEAIKLGASLTDKIFKPRLERKRKRTIGFE
ncbi:2-oxoacid:acceptor oxidoreductase family protein [Fervidobacterium sp. 2310opik-2]|uniref:2-oxoacid:acceptor oxidoreductase family protein n=1 Tax=Fervidobacterium sp. 2310opik-2 TaxID=1755815 RepID=UPI0013DEEDA4|nr:2-oxoacid:acceptor oxidoreductase family protein [Fervidobacterium sp. 2310opik-2]KAF2961796.1 pyruvate oxidoreductase subunit gamma [Fervidobacterium sp. 2310opik-2]HOJ94120.1 2-oxoacid:acceptor oxidoreductase family protein [Fervidobacterium nodosum]